MKPSLNHYYNNDLGYSINVTTDSNEITKIENGLYYYKFTSKINKPFYTSIMVNFRPNKACRLYCYASLSDMDICGGIQYDVPAYNFVSFPVILNRINYSELYFKLSDTSADATIRLSIIVLPYKK